MMKYWREFPPVHVLVARFIGYEAKEQRNESTVNTDAEIRRLASIFPTR